MGGPTPNDSNLRCTLTASSGRPEHNPKPRKPTSSKAASVSSSLVTRPDLDRFRRFRSKTDFSRDTTRSASSVLRDNLDPSKHQQAPRPATMGKGKGARASICLPQPAHAPLPTRPRNRGASARFLLPAIARAGVPSLAPTCYADQARGERVGLTDRRLLYTPHSTQARWRSSISRPLSRARSACPRPARAQPDSRLLHTSQHRAPRPSWQDSHHAQDGVHDPLLDG